MASEGLRVCKIVPSVWSGWKSPCAFELLRFGAEPGFRLLYSVFTDALKINKKPRLPPRYTGKTVKSNVTVHKSRGGWSHQSQLVKRAQVLPSRVEALAASLEVQSFAGKLGPRVVWSLVSGSDFGLEFSVLNLTDGGSNGSGPQDSWGSS